MGEEKRKSNRSIEGDSQTTGASLSNTRGYFGEELNNSTFSGAVQPHLDNVTAQ